MPRTVAEVYDEIEFIFSLSACVDEWAMPLIDIRFPWNPSKLRNNNKK